MGIAFAGSDCLDPVPLRDWLVEQDLPCPWFGLPNSYECPTGKLSGTGHVLLSGAALSSLTLGALYPYTATVQDQSGAVVAATTLPALLITEARAVTPGRDGDPATAWLCTLADRRHLYRHIAIDKAYNVPLPVPAFDAPVYAPLTKNGSAPWTWPGMFQDVWQTVGPLGAVPTLPSVPSSNPENFVFHASYALDALEAILDQLGLVLTYDPVADSFGVAAPGAPSSLATAALASAKSQLLRVWDEHPTRGPATQPASVRVLFRKDLAVPDATGAAAVYEIDVANPSAAAGDGSVLLYDELTARCDVYGNVVNGSDLADRASARASAYFQAVAPTDARQVLAGPQAATGLRPSSRITSIRFGDRGRGVVTEVVQRPQGRPGTAPPLAETVLAFVVVTSATLTNIPLGRQLSGVSVSGTTLTAADGAFTSADVGSIVIAPGVPPRTVTGGAIAINTAKLMAGANAFSSADVGAQVVGPALPTGTTIQSISTTNFTNDTAILSQNATQTVSSSFLVGTTTTIQSVSSPTSATLSQSATTSGSGLVVSIATGIVPCYPAAVTARASRTGQWQQGTTGWFQGANGEAPAVDRIYQCRLVGVDEAGAAIWCSVSTSLAWLKITQGAPAQDISLENGSAKGYAAVIENPDGGAGWLSTGTSGWFNSANGEVPIAGWIYQCRWVGVDTFGESIWEAASFAQLTDGYVTLSSIPATPPTITLPNNGTTTGYAGTFTSRVASGNCWLIAELNALFAVAQQPASGTGYPPYSGWEYQARFTGKYDTAGVPLFEIALGQLAGWVDHGGGAFSAYAGLLNNGSAAQNIPGNKTIVGNLTVGVASSTSPAPTPIAGNVTCEVLSALGPAKDGGTNQGTGFAGYYGLITTVFSSGNIEVGSESGSPPFSNGLIAFSTNGQFPTGTPAPISFSSLPDTQFLTLAAQWHGTGPSAALIVGTEDILFYAGGSQPSIFINSGGWLEGFTGSMSDGTQVTSGLVISGAGGQGSGGQGSQSLTIDGGQFYD